MNFSFNIWYTQNQKHLDCYHRYLPHAYWSANITMEDWHITHFCTVWRVKYVRKRQLQSWYSYSVHSLCLTHGPSKKATALYISTVAAMDASTKGFLIIQQWSSESIGWQTDIKTFSSWPVHFHNLWLYQTSRYTETNQSFKFLNIPRRQSPHSVLSYTHEALLQSL